MRRNSFISFNGGNKCIDSYLLTQDPRIRVLTPDRNVFISGFDFNPNPNPYISCCRIYLLQFFQAESHHQIPAACSSKSCLVQKFLDSSSDRWEYLHGRVFCRACQPADHRPAALKTAGKSHRSSMVVLVELGCRKLSRYFCLSWHCCLSMEHQWWESAYQRRTAAVVDSYS